MNYHAYTAARSPCGACRYSIAYWIACNHVRPKYIPDNADPPFFAGLVVNFGWFVLGQFDSAGNVFADIGRSTVIFIACIFITRLFITRISITRFRSDTGQLCRE
jgi:hypothetical protein